METLARPRNYVREILGAEPLLILGEREGGDLVLYASRPVPGYQEGEGVVTRRMPLPAGPHYVTDGQTYHWPHQRRVRRPPAFEVVRETEDAPPQEITRLFGDLRVFGYVPSSGLLEHYFPETPIGMKVLPSDASLAHEGAHAVSLFHIPRIAPLFDRYLRAAVRGSDRVDALHEAVAFSAEGGYIQRFLPECMEWYLAERAADQHDEYREADRLLREEPAAVEELLHRIKELNLQAQPPR